MWNITSDDIQRAKDELKGRRGAIDARYAEEIKALDADLAEIETVERAAEAFARKHREEAGEATPETDPVAAADPGGGAEAKPASRWRVHLAERPANAEPA